MIVTIDFETYFDRDFTLKKIPMAQYIRDPRFKAHGMGYKIDDQPSAFVPPEEIPELVDSWNPEKIQLLAHNTHFDGLILSYHYGFIPAKYLDTLSMARPLLGTVTDLGLEFLMQKFGFGEKEVSILDMQGILKPTDKQFNLIVRRAMDDVYYTKEIYDKLAPAMPEKELDVIDITIRMFTDPKIIIDPQELKNIINEEQQKITDHLVQVGATITDIRSDAIFRQLLIDAGLAEKFIPTKPSPTNPERNILAFAKTDSSFLRLQEHENEKVRNLVKTRLAVKSNQLITRANRLLSVLDNQNRLSIPLKYCGAHTFRWSGMDKINPQNFGRNSPIRPCISADQDHYIDVKDLSQIEARLVAFLAGETSLLEAFADETRDPYAEFASDLFEQKITKKTHPVERFIGKTCILGLGYQMGWIRLRNQVKAMSLVELKEELVLAPPVAQRFVYFYRNKYKNITGSNGLWKKMKFALQMMYIGEYEIGPLKFKSKPAKVLMPNDLPIYYPDLYGYGDPYGEVMNNFTYSSKKYRGKRIGIYEGKLLENIAMVRINKRFPVILQVHDEVISLIPRTDANENSAWITEQMLVSPFWAKDLPLAVEGGYSERYDK
jgi:DNA polymerase